MSLHIFRSKKCFKKLGWPMDEAADFFAETTRTKNETEVIHSFFAFIQIFV
jgi:hypothetical protein